MEQRARSSAALAESATLVKFSLDKPQIAYLFYPNFDTDAHPALQSSIQVNLETLQATSRDYSTTANPPSSIAKKPLSPPAIPTTAASPI